MASPGPAIALIQHPLRVLLGVAVLGLFALTAWACGDSTGPSGPKGPGVFDVSLVSPNGAEGSAVLSMAGGTGLGEITTTDGEVYFHHTGRSSKVIVILDTPGFIRFRVETQEVADLPSVAVVQVADGDDELRTSVSGYQVQIVQVEIPSDGQGSPGQ
jgi:hypothetical protein